MGSHKFEIYPVAVGAGHVALSPIPGRFGTYETDLSAVLHWGPSLVLTMTQSPTMERFNAAGLGDDLMAAGIAWRHLPIEDFGTPEADFLARWPAVSREAHDILKAGGRILAHCSMGCGRSGMIALRLMIEAGEDADAALARLRVARPCAVETDAQFAWAKTAGV